MEELVDGDVIFDDSNVPTLEVCGERLRNFPDFIDSVEKQGWGAAQGAFKIRLITSERETSLSQLLAISKKYLLNTVPQKQEFIRRSNSPQVYAYKAGSPCSDEELHEFRALILDDASYKKETCCSSIFSGGDHDALLHHYFETIRVASRLPIGVDKRIVTEERIERLILNGAKARDNYEAKRNFASSKQKLRKMVKKSQRTDSFLVESSASRGNCYCMDCISDGEDDESVVEDEKSPSSGVHTILYGAGIQLARGHIQITSNFSLSKLKTILDLIPQKFSGISNPYLYFGTTHSTFVAHVEDMSLWSINFLHYGSPKVWFIIPPESLGVVDFYLSQANVGLDDKSCRNILGHKRLLITKSFLDNYGIPYSVIIQHPGECVVLYPNAVHFGFNMGVNVAEAANFASISWIPVGLCALRCTCHAETQVHMDLTPLLAAFRPDLLRPYLEGERVTRIAEHPMMAFLKHSTPFHPYLAPTIPCAIEVINVHAEKEAIDEMDDSINVHEGVDDVDKMDGNFNLREDVETVDEMGDNDSVEVNSKKMKSSAYVPSATNMRQSWPGEN